MLVGGYKCVTHNNVQQGFKQTLSLELNLVNYNHHMF